MWERESESESKREKQHAPVVRVILPKPLFPRPHLPHLTPPIPPPLTTFASPHLTSITPSHLTIFTPSHLTIFADRVPPLPPPWGEAEGVWEGCVCGAA